MIAGKPAASSGSKHNREYPTFSLLRFTVGRQPDTNHKVLVYSATGATAASVPTFSAQYEALENL